MNILLLGSGGRESALAWKIAQAPGLDHLFALPGNPGTAHVAENISGRIDDFKVIARIAHEHAVDLVVVGPEAPLAQGIADVLTAQGIKVFGPSAAAARLESSKAFAKEFMRRWDIPSADFEVFSSFEAALAHIGSIEYPCVIKASGLAAGKGVVLPDNQAEAAAALRLMMLEDGLGEAGRQVVIEERLHGPEISLLAFSDGQTVATMPPARDHKRLLENDRGPNTGGMGTFAPVPELPRVVVEAGRQILQRAVEGMRREGHPYVGVLYAGLILTDQGAKLLEFNCRFGDPEAQVLLPLLETDLLEVMLACLDGRLEQIAGEISWSSGSAVCVVAASGGYPGAYRKGIEIHGLGSLPSDVLVFHAGTVSRDGKVFTNGGRVLGVTAVGPNLASSHRKAYAGLKQLHFEGMQFRGDIARPASAYTAAGVNIDEGNRAVEMIRAAVESTHNQDVLAGIGSFGGLFEARKLQGMKQPVLVASTDSVGTKIMLAVQLGRLKGLGLDIVNHCIDDILVQGARPLFFLDYFASNFLIPEQLAELVDGMAEACRTAGCVLLGGETAELPGMYLEGQIDLVGCIVGAVAKAAILPRKTIRAGDLLLGFVSSGPHTNGYSLIRKLFDGQDLSRSLPGAEGSLAQALLAPHRSYLPLLKPILDDPAHAFWIKGLAHITGGGFLENIPRILPDGLSAQVKLGSWPIPPVFQLIQDEGGISDEEMARVFNWGIGMIAVVAPENLAQIQNALNEPTYPIGEIVQGSNVCLV